MPRILKAVREYLEGWAFRRPHGAGLPRRFLAEKDIRQHRRERRPPLGRLTLRIPLLMAAGLLLTAAVPIPANRQERESLKGLKAVRVIVETFNNAIDSVRFTKEQVQTEVEQRLRRSGIHLKGDAHAILWISITGEKANDDIWAFSIRVDLDQSVLLERDH